ncbi:MAG: deaminase domain-containing protein [Peptostreptococcaceae bacterium]
MTKIKNPKKKQKLKIYSIESLKEALKKEGYKNFDLEEVEFKKYLSETFNIDSYLSENIHLSLNENKTIYKADNVEDFIKYIENITLFKIEYDKLSKKINEISKLNIDRIEYEREISEPDNVEHMIKEIEKIKNDVSKRISKNEVYRLDKIEKKLDKNYVYAKDIELLKKMILSGSESKEEKYNSKTKVKTLSIKINDVNCRYIPAQLGSIEYHHHIKNSIPRMRRLSKNINKYMIPKEEDYKSFNINQSETLNDTINIALAKYDNKEFKAISGSNEIEGFCFAPRYEDCRFQSSKVNKLGKLGVGYNRVNDSEKKIFEEIHKQIGLGKLKKYGDLTIYTKWEPCPSCYYVISQFCKIHPNINVEVKYIKKYGE